MPKKMPFLTVFFLTLGFLSSCSQEKHVVVNSHLDDSTPIIGDTIVEAGIGDARNLLPILASDGASGNICGLIFNGLLKYNKDLILTGDLAEGWEVSESGLEITFHLRRNVKWHDGVGFTSRDVEFTYNKLIDPLVKTPYAGDFERVTEFEVIDDYTIRVKYDEPFSPGLSSWGMNIMPRHLLEVEDINSTNFSRHPIGTGPYVFKRWKTQEVIELVANPDYFEGRPYIDKYIYRIIPDPTTMFLELQTQGIDYMGLTSLQHSRQTNNKFFEKNYKKFRYQGFNFTYLGLNLKDDKFSNILVRKAINYAIDKQEIIGGVLLGLGSECTGPFAPRSWAYNENVQAYPYDPEKAKSLLAEAGWRLNQEGILNKDGKLFEFTIITNQGNEERKRAAEIIQKRLNAIGIKVKIKIIEWSAFINEFINKRKFEAILLGWGLSLDPDLYDIWHSSKIKEGEFNFISYENTEVDHLIEQGRRIFDQTQRKIIYNRIHEIIYDEQPYIFLYTPDSLPILSSRFQGIEVAPSGISHNFIKWYVPKTRQKYILP